MDVSSTGEFIAVVEKIGTQFSTVLYDKANAQVWRSNFSDPEDATRRPTRVPLAVEYSQSVALSSCWQQKQQLRGKADELSNIIPTEPRHLQNFFITPITIPK